MKKLHLAAALGMALACALGGSAVYAQGARAPASSQTPGIVGMIKDQGGKPMAGVTVSARSDAQNFSTSVFTDASGLYVFPHLTAGKYKLWAQAGGYVTEKADVSVGARPTNRALTMKPLADFGPQMTGYEWFAALPDDTVEHKRMKQVLYVGCTGCHSLDLTLQNKFDEAGWNKIIRSMENSFYNGYRPGNLQASDLRWEGQIIRYHRDELAKYLAEVRGPKSAPLALKPLARPTGEVARTVITEYELPVKEKLNEPSWYSGTDWMLGPSTGMHGMVGLHDVILDMNGMAWISQARTTFETNRSLVKLDPATGEMKVFQVRDGKGELLFFEQISSPDPKGNIWMHDNRNVVRLDPKTDTFTLFPYPTVMGGMANSTDTDSKGRAVVNGRFGFAMFDPAVQGNKAVSYPGWNLYQQLTPGDGTTYGITADADDNIWWSESYSDIVAMRDMKTGKVTEFPMRDPDYDARKALATPLDLAFYQSVGGGTWSNNSASPLPYANMPRRLSADKKGDTVWVPNWAQYTIAEINIHTFKVTYHKLPIQVHPYKTVVDPQHNVWVDTSMVDSVWRFTPSTGQWTRFPQASHGCGSRHMSFDDYQGDPWLACDQSNKVMHFHLRSAQELAAQQAAAR